MPKRLIETTPLSEAGGSLSTTGRMKVHAITAGLGSSGYYSPEVIEAAANDGLIAKGTPLFLDHPSASDRHERPERSVKDIAAVFTEAATYDADAQALVGEIQVFAPYRDLLTEMAPYIGLSISGSATDVTEGEHDGRRVPIIEGLAAIDSVDWVTRAGRGGKVVELIESARFINEATVSDRAQQLSDAVRATHGGEGVYVWVRDQDAEEMTVWFEVSKRDEDGSKTYQQTYAVGDNDVDVTLTGEPVEVRRRTEYVPVSNPTDVPVARPGSTTAVPTEESKEDPNMPKIQIEESEHARLVETAGRVQTLEERATTAEERAVKAETALAESARRARAMDLIREHEHRFSPLEARGLVAELPLTESGDLDEEKFGQSLAEHAATAQAAAGAGQVSGFGQVTDTTKTTESAAPTRTAWGRPLTEQKGA